MALRKRAHSVREPQTAVAVAGAGESILVGDERKWREENLVIGLEKTREVLKIINDESLADKLASLISCQRCNPLEKFWLV